MTWTWLVAAVGGVCTWGCGGALGDKESNPARAAAYPREARAGARTAGGCKVVCAAARVCVCLNL